MKRVMLRLPDDLYTRLHRRAVADHRSLHNYLLHLLAQTDQQHTEGAHDHGHDHQLDQRDMEPDDRV